MIIVCLVIIFLSFFLSFCFLTCICCCNLVRKERKPNMVRPPSCCGNVNLKRGLWTPDEDAKILAHVAKYGTGNWTSVPKKAGLRRCGKSCRLRWNNYLRPDLNHETFKPEEEEMIVRLHSAIGSRWSIIAQQLPGRTDNDVKNHWNTKLRKKLSEMGIDPVTHKPFSQILTDYGNINGGLSRSPSTTRIGSLSRDLKNATSNTTIVFVHNPLPQSSVNFMESESESEITISESFIIDTDHVKEEQSMDLLEQLQAIKLVIEAGNCKDENVTPAAGNPSCSSSSSSTCSTTAAQEMTMMTMKSSPQAFSWRDFLLEDDDDLDQLLPDGNDDDDDDVIISRDQLWSSGEKQRLPRHKQNCYGAAASNVNGGPTTSSSFVDAILDGDRRHDMFLDFSSLLQDPNY